MYRDVGVLLLASLITAIDHVLACFLWPQSVYGVAHVPPWAWVNDAMFMVVEDVLLALAIGKSQQDMLGAARKQATIDASRAALEREVAERQRTERLLSLQYVITRVLAGANSLPEAAPVILRIMGENQGWHVGELWEVDESRQYLRCVDIWHADDLHGRRIPGQAARAAHRSRRGAAGPGLAAPPAAVDPGHGRGAHCCRSACSRRSPGCTGRSRSRCATAPRSSA